MTIKEMHYDFKQKFNDIDSQRNRDLIIPEIDWILNEAMELTVKMIVQPRLKKELGFEVNQRTIDDIRTIVIDQKPSEGIEAKPYDDRSFIAELPKNYWFFGKTVIFAKKGTCDLVRMKTVKEVQHDDEHEESFYDKSSFEWRHVNIRFNKQGLRVFTDGTFNITKVCYEYIEYPKKMHNAEDYIGNTYDTLDGVKLTGFQNCVLPEGIHREIVDLAVLIAAGNLNLSSYQLKANKVSLNQQ